MDHEPRFKGDVTEKRHRIMSKIRGKDTKPEIQLRKCFWNKGFRYRKNLKKLPGSPDIVLTRYKIAIFCDSEFFHGKDWEKQRVKVIGGANSDYWVKKIERNIERDRQKDDELRALGWTVVHFWSKEIEKDAEACFYKVYGMIIEQNK